MDLLDRGGSNYCGIILGRPLFRIEHLSDNVSINKTLVFIPELI